MSYRFKLPLDRDEMPLFLERRMLAWLDEQDSQHDFDYYLFKINYIGADQVSEEIPASDPKWNDIWADQEEGCYEKRQVITTSKWRWSQRYHVALKDWGMSSLSNGSKHLIKTVSVHDTEFEFFDDILAIQFRFMFEVKAENE